VVELIKLLFLSFFCLESTSFDENSIIASQSEICILINFFNVPHMFQTGNDLSLTARRAVINVSRHVK
jgi:hypothetical protein